MKTLFQLKDKLNRCLTIKTQPKDFNFQRDYVLSKDFFNYYPAQVFQIFSGNKNFCMILAMVFSCN